MRIYSIISLVLLFAVIPQKSFCISDHEGKEIYDNYLKGQAPGVVIELNVNGSSMVCAAPSSYNPFNDRTAKLSRILDLKGKASILKFYFSQDNDLKGLVINGWQSIQPWREEELFYTVGCVEKGAIERIYHAEGKYDQENLITLKGQQNQKVERKLQLEEFLKKSPESLPALKELAEIYKDLGDLDNASDVLDKIMILEF